VKDELDRLMAALVWAARMNASDEARDQVIAAEEAIRHYVRRRAEGHK